jgi:hypothetical protein
MGAVHLKPGDATIHLDPQLTSFTRSSRIHNTMQDPTQGVAVPLVRGTPKDLTHASTNTRA